mgnify:CR=1 FL=1
MTTEPIYLTDKQVALRYGVGGEKKSTATIWRWVHDPHSGFPKPHRLSNKCSRWKLSELIVWETSRAERAASENMLAAARVSATVRAEKRARAAAEKASDAAASVKAAKRERAATAGKRAYSQRRARAV